MKKQLLVLPLLLASSVLCAANVTLTWSQPTLFCDGTAIPAGSIDATEVYISENPIPASDQPCTTPIDVPPAGFTPVLVPGAATTTTVNLAPGKTYHFRIRVGESGNFSNFSGEVIHVIPAGTMQAPIILQIG